MDETARIILYTLGAGLCIPIGGLLASIERISPRWLEREFRHFVIAFGGGVLIGAVALVLIPEGNNYLPGPVSSVLVFVLGGLSFFLMERQLGLHKQEKPQLIAMLLDFIPESLALGGAFAVGASSAPLLALFIGLQNVPEGFNAYRELTDVPEAKKMKVLGTMLLFVPLGPIMGIIGWLFLSQNVEILGAVMLFASGGILYLIFQDIAPQSRMSRHWAPPLGAVLGFSLCMLGTNLAF